MSAENGARVVHRSPGRLRVRVGELRAVPELGPRIVEQLLGVSGVTRVEARPETGSVLVLYEPDRFDEEGLARAASEAELFNLRTEPEPDAETGAATPPAPRGESVYRTWGRANRAVNSVSAGLLDLRTLIPLAMVVWAIRQLIVERPPVRTPWYTLLWYAFGIFTRFNAPPKE